MLRVCEIFRSIQGESRRAGFPCSFVRLAGCNLSCTYCDTGYARENGIPMAIDEVVEAVRCHEIPLVEVTGGEPLLQAETPRLCERLCAEERTVMVETNGTRDISLLPPACVRIVDVKCPGSGACGSFLRDNLAHLRTGDECTFVCLDRTDFDWALSFVREHDLARRCTVTVSPAHGALAPSSLAGWILDSGEPVRLGLQIHKIVWGAEERGI